MLALKRLLCRLLIVLLAWTPFHAARAELIRSDQAVQVTLTERAQLGTRLQGLGIDAVTATGRIEAMTDDEVRMVTQEIESLPAGGIGNTAKAIWVLVIVGLLIWWLSKRGSAG